MKFRHELSYDAPATEVFAAITDKAGREYCSAAQQVISADITVVPKGDGAVVTIDQVQPTEGIPSFAKKFAGETTHAIQVEDWESPSRGTLTVDTPGRPSEVRGTMTLTESGGRTIQAYDVEVKAKVPLIGGKLEGLIAQLFKSGLDKEHAARVAWLGGAR